MGARSPAASRAGGTARTGGAERASADGLSRPDPRAGGAGAAGPRGRARDRGWLGEPACRRRRCGPQPRPQCRGAAGGDRKSTRLNSSHVRISYAVFCLKKKKKKKKKKK